jgi:hypothetical protein
MKQFLLFSIVLCLMVSISSAQYVYDPTFPDKTLKADSFLIGIGNGFHGVAVDPAGKIWTIVYNTYYAGDSVKVAGVNVAYQAIRIYLPNGQPASFSPLYILSGAGVTDTLLKPINNTGRGLTQDPSGNIWFQWFDRLYKLDYKTGAVIKKFTPIVGLSPTKSGIDVNGNFFIAPVSNNVKPMQMFDNTGAVLGNLTDTTRYFSRTVECSRDGSKAYFAAYTGHCVIRYTGDPLGGFVADTVLKGLDCEALGRAGKTDMLWAGSGSGNDKPNRYGNVITNYASHAWYLWNPTTNKIQDSIKWNGLSTFSNADSLAVRPRGVATTTNGDTVYVIMFGAKTGMYSLQRFIGPKASTNVNKESSLIPDNYSLSQNYPNPFNPTTKINFALKTAGDVSLRVYDVLGKEVAVLATGHYAAGSYSVEFKANNLSSGMYFYTLTAANGFHQTQKMILMK